ncbi:DUF3105 domain-containing protein [Catellatospora sp. NPDC049609]|uniref:DUF3105 domain-containing protein n=1 Tax=Catellatospora sp. NPDC049609 TaxID=3155505 RepID=UPI003416B4AE
MVENAPQHPPQQPQQPQSAPPYPPQSAPPQSAPPYLPQQAQPASRAVWPWLVGGLVVLLCLCGVVGVGGFLFYQARDETTAGPAVDPALPPVTADNWREALTSIDGVRDYFSAGTLSQQHAPGPVDYPQRPPVGGEHYLEWQTCTGMVYDLPIAPERAVHSMEHGAVWITYHLSLDAAQVRRLAELVSGRDYLMLSPFPEQDAKISVQAWGYQLKVDNADDPRIAAFIKAARVNAAPEPGAPCSGGSTATGPLPAAGTAT